MRSDTNAALFSKTIICVKNDKLIEENITKEEPENLKFYM